MKTYASANVLAAIVSIVALCSCSEGPTGIVFNEDALPPVSEPRDNVCDWPPYQDLCGQGYVLKKTANVTVGVWETVTDINAIQVGDYVAAFPDVQLTKLQGPSEYLACRFTGWSTDWNECIALGLGPAPCRTYECIIVTVPGETGAQ